MSATDNKNEYTAACTMASQLVHDNFLGHEQFTNVIALVNRVTERIMDLMSMIRNDLESTESRREPLLGRNEDDVTMEIIHLCIGFVPSPYFYMDISELENAVVEQLDLMIRQHFGLVEEDSE